jgi:hypothetical protein
MSPTLPLIEEAIDVPMMDVKNVAKIIDDYAKYDVREWNSFEDILKLEFDDFRGTTSFERKNYWFVKSNINGEIIYEFLQRDCSSWKDFKFDKDGKLDVCDTHRKNIDEKILQYVFLPKFPSRFMSTKSYDLFLKKAISKQEILMTYQKILKALNIKLKYINEERKPSSFEIEFNLEKICCIRSKTEDDEEEEEQEEDEYQEFYDLYKDLLDDILK